MKKKIKRQKQNHQTCSRHHLWWWAELESASVNNVNGSLRGRGPNMAAPFFRELATPLFCDKCENTGVVVGLQGLLTPGVSGSVPHPPCDEGWRSILGGVDSGTCVCVWERERGGGGRQTIPYQCVTVRMATNHSHWTPIYIFYCALQMLLPVCVNRGWFAHHSIEAHNSPSTRPLG